MQSDPASVSAHDFDDHYSMMRACGSVEFVECFVDGFGGFGADGVDVLEIARVATFAVGEGVAIGGAVCVRGADDNVSGVDAGHAFANTVAEDAGKSEQIETDNRDGCFSFTDDDGPRGEFPLLAFGG